ncbi:HET-domain-containing protein, partial [Stipitochalara longipes BDJ]
MVKVVHRWLTDCLESHDCGSGESTELPTRLLDIDSGTDNIRLFSPSAKGISEGKYVALSYCWGSHENFITTSKNYKTRSQGFSLKSMPRTLRDAVTLTRDLGCRYIWIDALCIIQGSDENALRDWAVESSLMNRVYGNSFITIAAASSNNCNGGIFAPRSCPLLARTNQDNGTKTEIITAVPCHRHRRRAEDEPLHGRAWALQEHILSRRVLMYNVDDISFHCDHGMEIEGDGAMYARGTIDRFPSRPKTPQISDWITAVVNYSSRSLTNHEDKLPAMAGIAQHYQLLTNFEQGRYLAGLWEHSLLFTLLWGTMTKTLSTMNQGKPKSYRAPSWSWASVDGRIWFQYDESSRKYFIYTATIIQCTIEVATANPFGQVASGDLVISGPVKKATGFTCEYTLA